MAQTSYLAALLPVLLLAVLTSPALATRALSAAAPNSNAVTLSILHFNDVHNRIEAQNSGAAYCPAADDNAGKCFGGFARIRPVIRAAKSFDPAALVLDAGDEFVGSSFDTIYKGSATANLESLNDVDVMTLGNHEFDFGPKVLGSFISRVNFPVVGACNVDVSDEPALAQLLKKYVIKEIKGVKIAIYGVLTNETQFTSSPGPNIKFGDPAAGLAACIKQANAEHRGIHLHIALTHTGYGADKLLAAQVKGLDLIVGAHSHTFLYTGVPPRKVSKDNSTRDVVEGPYPTFVNYTASGKTKTVPIVTAYFASRYVGVLTVVVDKKKGGIMVGMDGMPMISGSPMLLGGNLSDSLVPKDSVMQDLVGLYSKEVNAYNDKIVGSSLVNLDNGPSRFTESLIGDLACDAWLNKTTLNDRKIDFCIANGGGARASINKGEITYGQVVSAFPFANTIALLEMNGSAILGSLEWGTSAVGTTQGTGRFPQVSGLRYVYDARKPVGQRILSVKTSDGKDIDPCGTYVVLADSYLANGGDGYVLMRDSVPLNLYGAPKEAALAAYITDTSPVNITLDGRIVACHLTPDNPACTARASNMKAVLTTRNEEGSILPYTMATASSCA